MARFYLTKEFQEFDGLDMVTVHWTVAAPGRKPQWESARSLVLQSFPQNGGWIRRGVLDVEVEGEGPWILHHFFDWVRWGASQSGPAYFEEIAARPLEHQEHSGELTHATLVYNIGDTGWTNVVPMALEGAAEAALASPEWPLEPSESLTERRRRESADRLPRPLKFRARVLAPVGARVFYSIHLSRRQGLNPMADKGYWTARSELVI